MLTPNLGTAPGFRAIRVPGAEIHRQTASGTVVLLHLQNHGVAIHQIEIPFRRIVSAGAVGFEALVRLDRHSTQLSEISHSHERVVPRAQGLDGWARGDERHCSLLERKCPGAKDQRNWAMLTLPRPGIKLLPMKRRPFADSLPVFLEELLEARIGAQGLEIRTRVNCPEVSKPFVERFL